MKCSKFIAVLLVGVMVFAVVGSAYAVSKTYYRCRKCGKVAESGFGKLAAGSCSGFVHDWVTEIADSTNDSKYQKQVEETRQKAGGEAWYYGHTQGWW